MNRFREMRKKYRKALFNMEWERLKAVWQEWPDDFYVQGYMSYNPVHPSSSRIGPALSYEGEEDGEDFKAKYPEWEQRTEAFFDGAQDAEADYAGAPRKSEEVHPVIIAFDK